MKTRIDETSIVNHVIRAMPKALRVFRRHGIDSYRLVSELRKEAGLKVAAA